MTQVFCCQKCKVLYLADEQHKCSRNKYNARPETIDGHRFPSQREANEYIRLKQELQSGMISDLELQVHYKVAINGVHICTYILDFRYKRPANGPVVTVDVKGYRTEVYRLKKKLVEALYGIEIIEV